MTRDELLKHHIAERRRARRDIDPGFAFVSQSQRSRFEGKARARIRFHDRVIAWLESGGEWESAQ